MATCKFQKGDTVRCINDDDVAPVLRKGALYTVEEPRYDRFVRTIERNWTPERFDLVRPAGGFQIGDRVELGGWPLLVAKAEHIALAEHNLHTVTFIERPVSHDFKVGDRVNLKISRTATRWVSSGPRRARPTGTPTGQVLRRVCATSRGPSNPVVAAAFQHLADWLKFRPGDIVGQTMSGAKRRFRLAGRPGADGWVAWFGGPNPVPGKRVQVRYYSNKLSTTEGGHPSERVSWDGEFALRGYKVIEERGMTDSVASTPEEYGFFGAGFPRADALLRDKAYKAWLDEERDGRLRSAFEAGWKARGGK